MVKWREEEGENGETEVKEESIVEIGEERKKAQDRTGLGEASSKAGCILEVKSDIPGSVEKNM